MILFSKTETKFERIVLSLVIALILLIIVTCTNSAFSQQDREATSTIGVKITSPPAGQQVLTISGISTDDATTDCTVYADWNDQKPFQKAVATGPGGVNDYSTWNFTYTKNYNLITNGTNNLTSKLSCLSSPTNVTKWNSINVTGEVDLTLTTIANQTRNITDASQINTSLIPENNTTKTTVAPNNKTGNPIIDFFKGMFGT
ncbi:MAG: hypothetical protein K0R16_1650 [Nitrososphaeraceae archaeon]|nr:hypothetical protein [Nitrososphaeraceae archaeon]